MPETNLRNRRTPENAHQRWRWSTGGRVYAATASPELREAIARSGGNAAMSAYGDSPQARSLRASDLRRKAVIVREGGQAAWERLMESRRRSFGLPPDSLS